ncbi:universal stress protein [Chitinophaga defluvii]|uniref:Universal stress protein n=1 Tax=Chitinophaga defluvii TaxID=3163343 RepID=A0ABV2TET4_9BACT
MSGIMIAIDLSPFSVDVVNAGVELARKLQLPVTLLTIVEQSLGVALPEAGPAFIDDWEERLRLAEERMKDFTREHAGVDIKAEVMLGRPKEDTLASAREKGAEMLVIGTRGRTGLEHMLMGSTAEYIIRHSTIPVLVVPFNKGKH